jgi:hypothetical protein
MHMYDILSSLHASLRLYKSDLLYLGTANCFRTAEHKKYYIKTES